ncbi:PREDICTED: tetratricopeptide repeat protein 30B-like [Rhagoletis zephyria]|uniref:tetratricopeptide repeat protein 30B-like n=1 Tax=Rhagoletis zephyria TaxID=28612 RepID=UPI0008118F01|nr:PREDICTED: tetratricopeptide repeat protein 30B-like [Rhagoletis zephyria]
MAVLTDELYGNPNSRAALSLLAYCHYTLQDFNGALQCYEQLITLYPEQRSYLLNYAKCLFQTGDYEKALKTAVRYAEKFNTNNNNNNNGSSTNGNNNSNNHAGEGASVAENNSLLGDQAKKSAALRKSREADHYDDFAAAELIKLQAAIKYAQEEEPTLAARALLEQMPTDGQASGGSHSSGMHLVDREANLGCLLYKEKRYEEAIEKFNSCLQATNRKPDLLYNLAVSYYQLRRYGEAAAYIGEIIEQGIEEHPELAVGANTEGGIEVRSVGNTETLHESALVEAFNLRAAIEYQLKNLEAAREALTDMPPRAEEELDAVTLHNIALLSMDSNPVEGFEKLQFLIGQGTGTDQGAQGPANGPPNFPPETFANLLLLYCKHDYFELAADLMAENATYTYRYLSPYLYEFLDALITQQTSPEEAYQRFDELAARHTDALRRQAKQIAEARANRQRETLKRLTAAHEETLALYIPVLMAQAKIYWELEAYANVEKVFRKSAEFCNDLDLWKLNVAHVLFMQENKFKEATGFYEQLVRRSYDRILNVSAIVLANLCVSYIMTGQNEDAEELMRKIEKEEEEALLGAVADAGEQKKVFHLCIVNLVIGTLYCSKGNYEFGISRVIKSLDPFPKKLGTDTWFYAKRCFLAMLEAMARQVMVVRDGVLEECLAFLTSAEVHGRNVKAVVEAPLELETLHPGRNTVTYEARLLKALLLELMDG